MRVALKQAHVDAIDRSRTTAPSGVELLKCFDAGRCPTRDLLRTLTCGELVHTNGACANVAGRTTEVA
jgi:hypothetical protein